MDPHEILDVSIKEKNVALARAARREKLRKLFLQESTSPYRHAGNYGSRMWDPALLRVEAMQARGGRFFKPVPSQILFFYGRFVLPVVTIIYLHVRFRLKQEEAYRSGKVAYKDRHDKLKT